MKHLKPIFESMDKVRNDIEEIRSTYLFDLTDSGFKIQVSAEGFNIRLTATDGHIDFLEFTEALLEVVQRVLGLGYLVKGYMIDSKLQSGKKLTKFTYLFSPADKKEIKIEGVKTAEELVDVLEENGMCLKAYRVREKGYNSGYIVDLIQTTIGKKKCKLELSIIEDNAVHGDYYQFTEGKDIISEVEDKMSHREFSKLRDIIYSSITRINSRSIQRIIYVYNTLNKYLI